MDRGGGGDFRRCQQAELLDFKPKNLAHDGRAAPDRRWGLQQSQFKLGVKHCVTCEANSAVVGLPEG